MKKKLNKDSIMECSIYGEKPHAFVCQHLQYAYQIGLIESESSDDSD